MTSKPPLPARTQTDESLRTERSESDRAILEKNAGAKSAADKLIERARDTADSALETAREQADDKDDDKGDPASAARVARERASEDHAVEEARDAADVALHHEREGQRNILAGLLPLEREATDRHLLLERVRADESLANRDDFLGMVSHDLRNLLSGVAIEAEMLVRDPNDASDNGRTAVRARRIQRYAARMNRLIGDLVDVVSIDAGKLAIVRTRTDLSAIVAQTMDAFAQAAARAGVALTAECNEGIFANADGERVLQVLANLVGNALKFTPRGGRIVVQCFRGNASSLRLTVKDTGPGIPAKLHDAVFQRFWQNKDDQRGLGLGLYITRCIVDAHGGRIWVESALGEGAAFHVELPQAAIADASVAQVPTT